MQRAISASSSGDSAVLKNNGGDFYALSQNCEKRLLASSYPSVRPSALNNSALTRRIFMKFDV
jgi:hypothetical protein